MHLFKFITIKLIALLKKVTLPQIFILFRLFFLYLTAYFKDFMNRRFRFSLQPSQGFPYFSSVHTVKCCVLIGYG